MLVNLDRLFALDFNGFDGSRLPAAKPSADNRHAQCCGNRLVDFGVGWVDVGCLSGDLEDFGSFVETAAQNTPVVDRSEL